MTAKCIADIEDHERFIANGHIYQKIIMVNLADDTEHNLFLDYGSIEVNNNDNNGSHKNASVDR